MQFTTRKPDEWELNTYYQHPLNYPSSVSRPAYVSLVDGLGTELQVSAKSVRYQKFCDVIVADNVLGGSLSLYPSFGMRLGFSALLDKLDINIFSGLCLDSRARLGIELPMKLEMRLQDISHSRRTERVALDMGGSRLLVVYHGPEYFNDFQNRHYLPGEPVATLTHDGPVLADEFGFVETVDSEKYSYHCQPILEGTRRLAELFGCLDKVTEESYPLVREAYESMDYPNVPDSYIAGVQNSVAAFWELLTDNTFYLPSGLSLASGLRLPGSDPGEHDIQDEFGEGR